MTKDIEWLKKWVEEYENKIIKELGHKFTGDFMTTRLHGGQSAVKEIKYRINQLDEPEVLSKEWIDENEVFIFDLDDGCEIRYVPSLKLRHLISPNGLIEAKIQELIEAYKQEDGRYSNPENYWIDGFIEDLKNLVEEEQKYYVMNNDNRMMLVRMMDGKTITEADPFKLEDMYEGEKKSHRLTEQEIKNYDPRYMAFAKPIEELEE